jgi:branched-chain amino acid transport system permease protein
MVEQVEKHFWERMLKWCRSLAGVTVIATIVIALLVTVDRGGYVLVNTIVTGGMTALVAMGLALTLGVLNIPMFAHGEYFMIGSLTAYYVFTPSRALSTPTPALAWRSGGPWSPSWRPCS